MKKFTRTGKKALSVFLAVLMVMTAWVFVAPQAKAATAGSYTVRVTFSNSSNFKDDYTGVNCTNEDCFGITVRYKKNNGTGDEDDYNFNLKGKKVSGTKEATIPGFPTLIYIYLNDDRVPPFGGTATVHLTKLEIKKNGSYTTLWSGDLQVKSVFNGYGISVDWDNNVKKDWHGTDSECKDINKGSAWSGSKPVATYITMGGGSTSLDVPKTTSPDSVSSNPYTATVYDQYGVAWYEDATLTCDPTSKIDWKDNKITATNGKSNDKNNYDVTVTATCGSASATSKCTINVFDYKATFYDENGTTVLKAEQTVDYGNSATTPSNPTKASDTTNHYTFSGWSPTVAALTSGAQTVSYKATYKATPHSYTKSTATAATCTGKGTSKYTCSCGYSYTSQDIPALGHDFTSKTTTSTYLKSAATCTAAAVYYYKCSRCTAMGTNTYSSGYPLGHKWGEWITDTAATCTATGTKHRICSVCSARENGTIAALGHSYSSTYTVDTPATCTTAGSKSQHCTRSGCTAKQNVTPIPATGHTPGADATCTTAQTCTVCGAQLAAALNHDFTSKTTTDTYLKSAATCTDAAVYYYKCSRCSAKGTTTYSYGSALGHSMGDWTQTKAPTCTVEGSEKRVCTRTGCTYSETRAIAALGHDWDAGTVTTAPTCEGAGIKTFHCKRSGCGATKTETIDANGHTWKTDYTVDTAATCTTDGSKSIHCSVCNAIKSGSAVTVPKLGHDWGEWVITVNETCTTSGSQKRTCKRDVSHTETQVRPALDHNYATTFTVDKEPTCTETGEKSKHCSRCDSRSEITTIPAKGHSYGDWITDKNPTCTETGSKHKICSVCNDRVDETIAALGHNWESEWTVDLEPTCTSVGSKSHHCTRCSEKNDVTVVKMLPHSFEWIVDRAPLCWQVGLEHQECTVCHFRQNEGTEIAKIAHTPGEWTVTTEPNCTEKGVEKKFCTVEECKAELESREIPANGHTDGEWIIDKDSSCTQTGTKHQICSVCGETLRTAVIEKKEHTLNHEHLDATCLDAGYDRDRCAVCDQIFNKVVLDALGHDEFVESDTQPTCYYNGLYKKICKRCSVVLETKIRPALGHIYPTEGIKHEANCTMGEYIEYVCTRSGCTEDEPGHKMTEVFSNLEALGHDWSAWTPVKGKEPTCTEVGEEERSCQREGCDAKETRPLSKLGHNMKVGEKVAASCISGAYTPYTCQNNGCTFSYNVYDESQPATDHTWVTTTSQEGNVLTVTCECSVCHKTHTKEVTVDEVHNYSVVSEVKTATCTEKGKIRITCDGTHKAGCTEYIEVEIPSNAKAHNYVTTKQDATCKAEGYVLSKCSLCGDEIRTVLPKTAHAWDKGVVTTAATCTSTGVKTYTCSICGDTYTEVIAQLAHDFELQKTVAPTCKDGGKSGYKVYKCKTCSASYNEITDDAISHAWGDWTTVQKPTDKLNGIEKRTCSVCGEEQLRTTAPIGDHNFVEDASTKKPATCTADGSVTMKCDAHTDCGVTYEKLLPKLGHDMVADPEVDATCEHEGYIDYKCSRCDHSYRIVTAPAAAHTFDTHTQPASCLEPAVTYTYCTKCNKLEGAVHVGQARGHDFTVEVSYKAPTNTANGEKVLKCSRCEETITVTVPAQGHEFELVSSTPASCSADGLETYKCKTHTGANDCGLSYTNVIPKTAHTYSTRVKTAATCTTTGTGEYYCTVCNEVFGEYDIAALGHDYSVKINAESKAATCNAVGYDTYKCSRCDDKNVIYLKDLAAHSWGEWETKQEQTDVLPKIEVRQCSVCGVYDYRYTAPSGAHDWDEGQVTTPATCTTEGERTYTCKRTHCACPEGSPLTYTEVIPATGHSAKVENKEATCTEAGYVKAVCEICHAELDSKVLPIKEHAEKVTVTEPTCTTPGSKVYTCAVCGATTKPTEQIPVVPHAYEATGEYTDATCTTPKYETYKCKYCDATQLVKVAEANGHDTTENYVVKETATCTKAGYSEWRCDCGVLLGTKVLQPTEHTWETVTEPLPKECEGAKVTYEKCSVCGAIKVDSVVITESGDHVYKVTTKTPATCTTPGTLVITCEHCSNVNTEVEIPAVGHAYGEGVLTEGTCETDGIVTFTCTRVGCTDAQTGHTITKNIGKKNHNYVASGSPIAATCTSSGYQLYKCEYCNKEFREILEAPANHIYEKQSESVEPNCYQRGHYIYKCKNCIASYEYDLPETGNHNIKSEVIQAQSCTLPEITKYTCETVGCPYLKKEITKSTLGHDWDVWKVTREPNEETGENGEQVRTCKRSGCDATETAPIPASIHNWGATPIETTDASCTAAETKTYKCIGCNLCNETNGYKTYVKTIGVPLQHNVVVEYKAATCTAAGSYIAKCSLCGKVFKEETLAAKGHSFNTYLQDTYVPATCTVEGSVTYACSNDGCGETQTTVLPVNPNAHNMDEDPANSKTATCTTAGYKAYKCANQGCDHMYMMQIEDPTAHTAKDDWTVVRAANCHSDGYKVLECKDCNAILKTETIPATGSHTWETVKSANENPTCTESSYSYKKCSVCGKLDESSFTVKNATGHDFSVFVSKKDATPTENGYVIYKCSHDGCAEELKSVISASGHSFTSAVTKEPTCTEKGVKTFTCTVHPDCKSNYTEEIPALGHLAGDVELTAATCLSEGSATVRCTREGCSVVLHSKKIAKLPHTFNDTNRVVVDPTCQTTGSVTYTCTTAGCTAKLVTTLDKIPHDYGFKESVPPTCTDSGYDIYVCDTEGCTASYNVVTTSASGHKFTEDTARYVAPGCATVGHKYFKCSICGIDGYDYEVPATGSHTYNVTETVPATCETAGYTYNKCACGAVDNSSVRALDPLGHNYIVDMGNGVMKCERCDKTITAEKTVTEDGVTHAFIGKITKQSTCQEHGIISYTCQNHADCAKNHTEELPLASHSATAASIVKVDPQCKADGTLINGSITVNCSVCGTQIGETIIVPAAHRYTVVKVERATCGSKGKVTERCSVCGNERVTELEMNTSAHEFEAIPAVSVAATCTTDGYAVYNCKHCDAQKFVKTAEKLEHKHTESFTKDATCEAEGYIRITCVDCGKILSEETLEKTPHTKEVITVEPTCTSGGTITTKCSVCGKLLEDIVYTPAKGHTWGDWVVVSGGTCMVEGKRKRVCTVCHETETISTGVGEHVYPAEGVVTPPTCTTDGFTTYTCTVCKNHSIVKNYVPKLGHVYSNDYKIVIEPTCHSTGSKARYCVNCGSFEQDKSQYIELPKLAHTYGEWVVVTAPTCDTNGVRVRTCTTGCSASDQGHTQTEAVGKIGHNYGDWEVTKKATCVEEGSQRRYCDRCKTWEVQTIPKGGHNRVADNAVEATCTAVGKTAGSHCSLCGYVFVAQKEIPMKDHMDLNGDGKCEGCNMTMHFDDGKDTCLCHGTGFRAFIYKIVLIIWKIFKINKTCVCGAKHY